MVCNGMLTNGHLALRCVAPGFDILQPSRTQTTMHFTGPLHQKQRNDGGVNSYLSGSKCQKG